MPPHVQAICLKHSADDFCDVSSVTCQAALNLVVMLYNARPHVETLTFKKVDTQSAAYENFMCKNTPVYVSWLYDM